MLFRSYKDGQLDGASTEYDENGKVKSKGMWKNGVPVSPVKQNEGNAQSGVEAEAHDAAVRGSKVHRMPRWKVS